MGRSYYDCFGKNAKEWLNDKKLPKGMSEHNVVYLREYKDLLDEYKKYTVMLYFMLSVMKIEYVRSMFYSCKRSKEYIIAMVLNIKKKFALCLIKPKAHQESEFLALLIGR